MINQIKKLIGIKTIAFLAGRTERQVYNLLKKWEKEISKRDKYLLFCAIDEKINELEELRNELRKLNHD
jgi:hypothetical protein